jgi:hypothetical protein
MDDRLQWEQQSMTSWILKLSDGRRFYLEDTGIPHPRRWRLWLREPPYTRGSFFKAYEEFDQVELGVRRWLKREAVSQGPAPEQESDMNLYMVNWHGEEGQTAEHGIFVDPNIARGKAVDVGLDLAPFSCVVVTSYKREGAEFVPTVKGDPGHYTFSVEWERPA